MADTYRHSRFTRPWRRPGIRARGFITPSRARMNSTTAPEKGSQACSLSLSRAQFERLYYPIYMYTYEKAASLSYFKGTSAPRKIRARTERKEIGGKKGRWLGVAVCRRRNPSGECICICIYNTGVRLSCCRSREIPGLIAFRALARFPYIYIFAVFSKTREG